MAQFLLELFSEEIPARMQAGAARDLGRLARAALTEAALDFSELRAFAGPRRLTLVVDGLPAAQADRAEERKGPRVGAPDAAIDGFLRSTGLARDALTQRDGAWFATIAQKGRPTADILAEMTDAIVRKFPWPKSMTWGAGTLRWVRPLHRILAVFDGGVVPIDIDGIVAGDMSEGHRVMGSKRPFAARNFDAYRAALAENFVVLDADERRARILAGARALTAAKGLELVEDAGLLDEVAGMAEWPVPILGDMDAGFLTLPPEVIRTSMRVHQRYFAVRRADGTLAARFIAVANLETPDGGALIAAGNARVLAARLNDARFFWDEDLKVTLESRLQKLDGVTFHAKLGTMRERVDRIARLSANVAMMIGADHISAGRAGLLAKADLATGMVGEFPELQGIMGAYYANSEDLAPEIVAAIGNQYRPQGPSDIVPVEPISIAVALAEKIDLLVNFFAIGEKPTGSRDPFALRRAALGAIRIILENKIRIPLSEPLFAGSLDLLRTQLKRRVMIEEADKLLHLRETESDVFDTHMSAVSDEDLGLKTTNSDLTNLTVALKAFFLDRLKVMLRDGGQRHDLIDAVFALGDDDLVRVNARLAALAAFLDTPDGANLLAGCKRATSILAAEAKNSPLPAGEPIRVDAPAAEAALFDALEALAAPLSSALAREDFANAMTVLARLRGPVDAFFDEVLVNSDDPAERANRLRLLARVRDDMAKVADFALISG